MNNNSTIRVSTATLLAILITAVMFSQLYNLTSPALEFVWKKAPVIDFKRLRTDSPLVVKPRDFPKPVIEVPGTVPGINAIKPYDKVVPEQPLIVDKFPGGTIAITREPPSTVATGSDRDVVPLVRVSPEYPPRAAARNIEGWVQVRFNITSTGSVTDVMVVGSEPQGYFEKAAVDAVARWRYSPKVEGAVSVERRGVETKLRFELPPQ